MLKRFKIFFRKRKPLWLIPILILLIILTIVIVFKAGEFHTPFIYSTF